MTSRKSKTAKDVGRSIWTPAEVAERAGVCVDLIYKNIRAGKLKAIKVGLGQRYGLRIRPEDEQAWLETLAEEVGK